MTIFVSPDNTIRETMKKMTDAHMGVIAVLDGEDKLFGIIVDGDIRRALVNGADIDEAVKKYVNRNPVSSLSNMTDVEIAHLMKSKNKMCIPIVDSNNKFIKFKYFDEVTSIDTIPNKAIILAGGFGKRLMPYTSKIPKPMLNVGGKPLVEKIIDGLVKEGINDITLLLHYMPEVFIEYFSDKEYCGKSLKFIIEEEPKGTAGGLHYLKNKIDEPFLVLNGDNIIYAKWKEILSEHINNDNIITIGASEYSTAIPFGVIEHNDNIVTGITEKPIKTWLTVCSAYCISSEALKYIPDDEYFDMPDLIGKALSKEKKVGYFRVGDYQRIEELAPSHKPLWAEQQGIQD